MEQLDFVYDGRNTGPDCGNILYFACRHRVLERTPDMTVVNIGPEPPGKTQPDVPVYGRLLLNRAELEAKGKTEHKPSGIVFYSTDEYSRILDGWRKRDAEKRRANEKVRRMSVSEKYLVEDRRYVLPNGVYVEPVSWGEDGEWNLYLVDKQGVPHPYGDYYHAGLDGIICTIRRQVVEIEGRRRTVGRYEPIGWTVRDLVEVPA